jgi:solute carrier family 35 protein F5
VLPINLGHCRRALILSGVFNVVTLAGGITWYLSLESTSVAANTAIYMSLPAFIFVLSVPVLRERPTVLKVLAVFVQVGGVCIVAVSKDPCAQGHPNSTDSSNSSHILGVSTKTHCGQPGTPLGYVLLLISVLTYALFEILYKKFASFKDDPASIPNSFRMIGLIGIHCLVYSWPLVIIAHFSGLQPFQWPTLLEFKYILMTSVLDFILNVSLILVVSLTSPLFAG